MRSIAFKSLTLIGLIAGHLLKNEYFFSVFFEANGIRFNVAKNAIEMWFIDAKKLTIRLISHYSGRSVRLNNTHNSI